MLGRFTVLVQSLPALLPVYFWDGYVFETAGCAGPGCNRRVRPAG